ncbi:MAG TPA: glycosyltransferase family 4 protein [Gaiellaceae bacterium]|nr:glycosyltransferase family 4 protein [Gaiellaceae bacterium]
MSRTRYRLPLDASVARKWDALAAEMELRVLAGGDTADDGRFRLVPGRSPAFYLSLPLRVAEELRRFRPDVVVAQSPYEASSVLAGRSLARSHARVVLEVHGDWHTATRLYGSPLRRLLEPVSTTLARAAVRRVDAVRTVSQFTSGLVRAVGVEPATTFTTYFDVSAFSVTPPAPLPAQPRALFVGVLERYKNVHGLAEAWRRAAPAVPDATLHVIGRGRERSVVEALVRDFPRRVTWDEQVPSAAVAAALDRATVLVLPSFSEGLPRVAMEAFARGRAVVGARAGGIPDIVEDGTSGLLVPSGNVAALADALVRVLSDPQLARSLADGARASAARWLQSPEEFATRTRELVDSLRR